ncbi:hypothetical protein D5S18_32900 [Nocardia panacis]|uniref:Uncharacterized protein n=1 Tax=Nocardia panacis TaxID=2340916 RepID=A0A3A4JWC5_9NOCA|nr:hypothetical protein [Nocardia panacis]RJO68232.1 hypothetical protein D5S18_32900 [Nocardia panacis]
MLVILLVVLVVIVVGAGALIAMLGRKQRGAQEQANEVVPGHPTRAPISWAGSHDPEARLHRRLRDAMTALRRVSALDNGTTIVLRADLEQSALAVDDHLVALSGLTGKADLLASATQAVEAIEAGVTQYATAATKPDLAALEVGMSAVRGQLDVVAQIRKGLSA